MICFPADIKIIMAYYYVIILIFVIFCTHLETGYSALGNFTHRAKILHQNISGTFQNNYTLPSLLVNPMGQEKYAGKSRTKRASGEGKYAETASTGQMKMLRVWLQLFKNIISTSDVGGMHPLHPSVPKIFLGLIKEKVVTMFVPEVGKEKKA